MDLVTVTERLHRKGELEAVGGAEYVSDLLSGIPRLTTADHYAKIIKRPQSLLQPAHPRREPASSRRPTPRPRSPATCWPEAEQAILEVGDQSLRSTLMVP